MLKRTLLCTAGAVALSIPTISHAQAEGVNPSDAGNVIIVTATRRAEDIQDVPIAVTAVNPEQLERQGVANVQSITSVSPSFSTSNAQNAGGTVVLRIRGVGTTSNNIGFESAVGIFIDGAYQSRPGIALSEFVDIERVEILRGPQGTLFGRNTSAGALNITTVAPDVTEFGGFANASYGNYDFINLQGAVNVPLIQDTLAVRITGAYSERDGYLRLPNAVDDSNEIDRYLVRGQLGYESAGGVTLRLIGDYSRSTATCCQSIEVRRSPVEEAGLFALVGLGARGGINQPNTGQQAVDDLIGSGNFAPLADIDQWGITGELNVPLGDNAELVYIGSYREFRSDQVNDSDFTGINVVNTTVSTAAIDTWTHELRLQGEALDGRLSWLVGGYYADESITARGRLELGSDYDALIGALIFGPTGGMFGNSPLQTLSGGFDPNGAFADNLYTQNSESWSIFTHNTFEIVDGLNLTLGLRYSDESKDGGFAQLAANNQTCTGILANAPGLSMGPLAGLVPTLVGTACFPFTAQADLPGSGVAGGLPTPATFQTNFSDDELIYTVKLGYEFPSIPINVYASFTHGYKSGGINLDSTAAASGADPRFASEEVDAYEVGLKARFLDDALSVDVALFHQEFSNFQVLEFTGTQFQTFNVPQAISTGLEIEILARPNDNWTFNGGLTYVGANYPDDCATVANPIRVQNLCGNPLTNAPDLVAIAGITYENEIGDNLDFFLNGQIRTESDRRTSTQPSNPASLADTAPLPFDFQDSNTKINLRAGIGAQDDSWGVEVWATNITNQITRGVTFNTVLRSGSRSTFPQEPRMYGLTVRTRF